MPTSASPPSSKDARRLLSQALRYLKYRFRSESELFKHLKYKNQDAPDDLIQQIIDYLKTENLINDIRFCEEWTYSQLNKGKGPNIIRKQLQRLGISSELISSQLQSKSQSDFISSAKSILNRKSHKFSKMNPREAGYRIRRYLYQRGFRSQTINIVIDDELHKRVK